MAETETDVLTNPLAMFDVSGKTALVTGASGAFGRATSLVLGSLGANLVLASGTLDELDSVAGEVRQTGAQAVAVNRRPDTLDDAEAMLAAGLEAFGAVDMLVVAAGMNKSGFIHEMEYDDWQAVMDANVRGAWLMAKAVGTYWIANE